ncbi:unnamed protein product [Enterobius vermicularis]|uniref:Uncharacterized protein n=1 Tax=Enterobius vermicularis TaxID=51028 RepID=A0A0N4UVV2_ENTVE|nr:unnamed protein product [Enterobius vermicularis]
MFLTRYLARARLDHRPLYRRIFTNQRLDLIFLVTVRSLIGFSLSLTSFIITDLIIYSVYTHPEKKRLQSIIEKKLIEADSAGFS